MSKERGEDKEDTAHSHTKCNRQTQSYKSSPCSSNSSFIVHEAI